MALLLAGCGPTDSEQACLDTADALASSAQRCGLDYQVNFDVFVDVAAGGDCANITAIRDQGALYDECIPFFRSLSCEQLNDPTIQVPEGCKAQFQR